MNRQRREQMTAQVTEILTKKGVDPNPDTVYEIVTELGKIIYESLNRKVPYEVHQEIWRKYNLEGGYTVNQLAVAYRLSITTVTAIVKNKYW